MKTLPFTIATVGMLALLSCGPNAKEVAMKQKVHEDSMVTAAVNAIKSERDTIIIKKIAELKTMATKAQDELASITNDPNFNSIKARLTTVRARISTGGTCGWIDDSGKFSAGKESVKAFDEAVNKERDQMTRIQFKNAEIQSLQDRVKDMERLLPVPEQPVK
jgi:hypothetical protein